MEITTHLTVFGFIGLGGLVAMLPIVLMGKFPPKAILNIIGMMFLILCGFSVFYTVISDYSLIEIYGKDNPSNKY